MTGILCVGTCLFSLFQASPIYSSRGVNIILRLFIPYHREHDTRSLHVVSVRKPMLCIQAHCTLIRIQVSRIAKLICHGRRFGE